MPSLDDEQDLPTQDPAELNPPEAEAPPPEAPAAEPAAAPEADAPAQEAPQTLGDAIQAGLAAVGDEDVDEEGIPHVGERARERFRELVKARKDMEEQVQRTRSELEAFKPLAEQHQQLMLGLAELGIDEQAWSQFFNFSSLARSQNVEDVRRAFSIIEEQRRTLAERLMAQGAEIEGYDPLDAFPDLRARVDAYELTRDDALKLAQYEALKRQRAQPQPARQATPQAPPQAGQGQFSPAAVESARSELNALHAELASNDPDFAAVYPALTEVAGRILVSAPREQWAPLIRQAYGVLKKEAARGSRQGQRRQQPLPSTPAGGVGKGVPNSLRDAISAGLASVRAGQ